MPQIFIYCKILRLLRKVRFFYQTFLECLLNPCPFAQKLCTNVSYIQNDLKALLYACDRSNPTISMKKNIILMITLLLSKFIISISFSPDLRKISFALRILIATFYYVSKSIASITEEKTPFLFASLWLT